MQRSFTCLSFRSISRRRFILPPATSRIFGQSNLLRVLAGTQKEYLVGLCSGLLLNSHRNYIPGVDQQKGIRKAKKNDCFARNKMITKLGKEGKWKEILHLYETEKGEFNSVNWATAFSQLGRIKNLDRCDRLFESFVNEYADRLESRGLHLAGIREVGNVVYVIAKMKLRNPATKSILEFVSKKENARIVSQQGYPEEISIIAWSFATLGAPSSHELFTEIEMEVDWLVQNGDAQAVANTAWAFATLGIPSPTLFTEIEKRADWLVKNGKEQEVSSIVWAYEKMEVELPKLFAKSKEKKRSSVSGGGKTSSDDDVVALNRKIVGLGTRQEWKRILNLAEREKHRFDNVNWATTFSQLGKIKNEWDHLDALFLSLVKDYAACLKRGRLEWAGIREVVSVLQCFGKMKLDNYVTRLVLDFVSQKENAQRIVQEGSTHDIADTAWTFAVLRVLSPTLFHEIEKRADWLVQNGTTQDVAVTAWAFAKLDVKSPKLFAEIENHMDWLVQEGSIHSIASTAFAFATLDIESPKLRTFIKENHEWLLEKGSDEDKFCILKFVEKFPREKL